MRFFLIACLFFIALRTIRAESAQDNSKGTILTKFTEQQWDRSPWRPLRLPNQSAPRPFISKGDCLTTEVFTREDIKAQQDNALLAVRRDPSIAQVQMTFSIGSEPGAAAGFFVAEDCTEDMFLSGTVIFVARNRLAIWEVVSGSDSREVKYTHLVQLAHAFAVGEKHVLTCSFSKSGGLAVQVDNTDVLSLRKCRVGSVVGIWGCHGSTYFYDFTQQQSETLSEVWTTN